MPSDIGKSGKDIGQHKNGQQNKQQINFLDSEKYHVTKYMCILQAPKSV